MAKVIGLGGVFFKTPDPQALKDWYARVLGFQLNDWGVYFPAQPVGGTVWSPFAPDTQHFEPSKAEMMINLMVDDMDGMLARVRAEGVEVLSDQEMEGMGRFASILDPTGVKVELWQPAAETGGSDEQPEALDVSQA